MKFLKSSKGAVTFLLVALLFISCFWIVKSEIRASSLQSRLDEHHAQLKNNSDVLEGLVFFDRGTSKANIQITEDIAFISSELASIKLKNNKVEIETPGEIQIGNGNEIKFGYDKKLDALYLVNKGSKLYIGKLDSDNGSIFKTTSGAQFEVRDEGVLAWVPSDKDFYSLKLSAKKKFVELKKDNSKIRFEGDDINIEAKENISIKVSDEIKFGYDKKLDALYMTNKGSKMYVGKLDSDYGSIFKTTSGVQFEVRDEGILAWAPSDKGFYSLKLSSKKKFVELKKDNSIVRFEGDDINIEAPGDINITSKNGKVNINGKK